MAILSSDMLPQDDWRFLTQRSRSWYETPGHCLLYDHNPAKWIATWRDDSEEQLLVACYWSVFSCFKIGKHIRLNGSTSASYGMLRQLMRKQKGFLLTIPYLEGDADKIKFPWWQGVVDEFPSDWIIALPDSYDTYLNNLNKTTRKHLGNYCRHFGNDIKSDLVIQEKEEIKPEYIKELAKLHRQRMENSGKNFALTPEVISRRTRLAKECGLFCGRFVNGRLVGGTLNYYHGTFATLSLVAHDPQYDKLHCGIVCVTDTIKHLIDKGLSHYNLHMRYSPFKVRMGGIEHKKYELTLFANFGIALLWFAKRACIKLYRHE